MNSPGNFTASKLAWIKEYEPDIYDRIHEIMLPGDFIAMRLTGDIVTTVSGLSGGIFWDFKNNALSEELMNYYGFSKDLIADIRPTFGFAGRGYRLGRRRAGLEERHAGYLSARATNRITLYH